MDQNLINYSIHNLAHSCQRGRKWDENEAWRCHSMRVPQFCIGVNSALITKKKKKNTSYLFNGQYLIMMHAWNWDIHTPNSLPLIWNESIAGDQHNLRKFGRVTVHSHDGQWRGCNVYHGLGSNAMLSWMFTPSFDAMCLLRKLYIKILAFQ